MSGTLSRKGSYASLLTVLMLITVSLMIAPVVPASDPTGVTSVPTIPEAKGDDFTHHVLLELFVTTSCGYCPSAEAVAKQLNSEYSENFVFVTMVLNENDKARERSDDYQVQAIPDGVFDGGYRREFGGQSDTSTYEGHIEDCGNRNVPEIDLSVEAMDNGDGTMDVSYSATYRDIYPFYDAHLRVYIVERESRYPDMDDHPIPYGFIDYAFDEDLRLAPQVETTDSTTWTYDDYENATFDNFVVIAALFDKTSGVERYSVQTATTETTNILISDVSWDPENPNNDDKMSVFANVTGDVSEVEFEYSLCTSGACGVPETEMMEVQEGSIYTVTVGGFDSDVESIHFKIIARDAGGNEVKTALIDLEYGMGSSSESSGIFEENGMLIASGGTIALLILVFAALFIRNKGSKQEIKELQERLAGMEEDNHGPTEEGWD